MASGVCDQCRSAFTGTKVLRTGVPHHETPQALRPAADRGCYICRTVTRTFDDEPATNWEELNFQLEMYLTPPLGLPNGWLKVTVEQIYTLESSTKNLCDVLEVSMNLKDPNNTYGQVMGGKITLQASLIPCLPWYDGGIAVFDRDTKQFRLINTPQALLDQYGEQLKSAFYEGDECDELGDPCSFIMSNLGNPQSMTAFSSADEVDYYCLPVQSFEFEPENRMYASEPGCNELLLRQKDGTKQFVRVGNFEARGHDEVKHFVGKERQVIEIL